MSNKKKSAADTAISTAEENKIISMPIIDQACEKIKTSAKAKLNNKAKAIESATAAALKLFCKQSEEFARAIVESDKTFEDCLNEIVKGVGSSISDFDIYSKAVEFYFPGAKIEFKMLIHMSEYEMDESNEDLQPAAALQSTIKPAANISLSLDSLLDW